MLNSQRAEPSLPTLELRGQPLTLNDVDDVVRRGRPLQLTADASVIRRVADAADLVGSAVDQAWRVYGVTTGFGGMADVPVAPEEAAASQSNLLSFLDAAAGPPIARRHVQAAMLLRANMLLRGVSGVRMELIERLVRFLDEDAMPVVRELGSIGASGDLVPLSAVARAITGQGRSRVRLRGRELDGPAALAELGLRPLELLPKEGLAIVNGTSFSAAIAANSLCETRTLTATALASHAIMLRALGGHEEPFSRFVHEHKPHPGQVWSAAEFRLLLEGADLNGSASGDHLQDRYSLRCLPQYFGPLVESLARIGRTVETEMNAVTDNPLVDTGEGRFHQSGNFLGQYIAMAMDELRGCLALTAKHLDVQIAQLVSPEFSSGLPPSLRGNGRRSYNAGLKGLQITGNSIVPMLSHLANPLVQHYPTHAEQHNQNINGLSWGAANLAWRSVELHRQFSALALLFAVQAADLRAEIVWGHADGRQLLGPRLRPLYEAVCEAVEVEPGRRAPLIFDDSDQSLEVFLHRAAKQLGDGGGIARAVAPIVESMEDVEP